MECSRPNTIFFLGTKEDGKLLTVFIGGRSEELRKDEAERRLGQEVPARFFHPDKAGYLVTQNMIYVPCGKCPSCRAAYSREWAVRSAMELETSGKGVFVTLTYELAPDRPCKEDLQGFWKRLRSYGFHFRYLACGEFGSQGLRPHYHAVLFGVSLEDLESKVWSSSQSGWPQYRSPWIEKAWPYGFALVSEASAATGAYVAAYVAKKSGRLPGEFLLMSRKPALGTEWILRHGVSSSVSVRNGTAPLPRTFRRLIEQSPADRLDQIRYASVLQWSQLALDVDRRRLWNLEIYDELMSEIKAASLRLAPRTL